MNIRKYNGCGNDFVILPFYEALDYSQLAQQLCNRFDTDGLIAVKETLSEESLEMIFYNRDGSRAPMCGNGIRCFAQYVRDLGIISAQTVKFPVKTLAGVMKVEILHEAPCLVRVDMGTARIADGSTKMAVKDSGHHRLDIAGLTVDIYTLFMGTIHTVVFVDNAADMLNSGLGEQICNYPLFLEKTNVNFVQLIDRENLSVRTFERGVGWTLACGTGCCASAVIAQKLQLADNTLHVHLDRGELLIENRENEIFMTGSSEFEFESEVIVND
ncbi:diaminopimelate epimerase [Lactovum odontotermitis]